MPYRNTWILAAGLGVAATTSGNAEALRSLEDSRAWATTVTRTSAWADGIAGGNPRAAHALSGIASYYWQGQVTASGERFDKTALTAAHPSLPFNTLVRVTDRTNGNSVVVRINDRGPFKPGRIIDLSEQAADVIDLKPRGLAPVDLEVLSMPQPKRR